MRIFVTGGTGFIGKHLVRKLQERGHSLLLLSQKPLEDIDFIEGDLADIDKWKAEVEKFKPDACIYLAWEGLPDYSAVISIRNLEYGIKLFRFLAEIGCKTILSTGTCWEYGQQSGKLSEDMALKPLNAFTAAKNSLHWLGKEIAKENNMQFIWTRLFYVYGPGQRETSLIPYLINCAKTGKTPEIKNPSNKNDFIYITDVVRAIVLLLKHCKKGGIYNIGSGKLTAVKDIVEIIAKKFDIYEEWKNIIPLKINTLATNFYADISKIKGEIDWELKVGIEQGIQKTIDNYFSKE